MSRPMGPVLYLGPYSGLSVQQKVLMQHSRADTSSLGLYWGKKEHTASVRVPQMTGTEVSRGLGSLPLRTISS